MIEPVIIGKATLYNMDCMEYMATLPDKYFDLAIVDPPYGIGENGDKNSSRGKLAVAQNYKSFAGNDDEPPPIEYFKELIRVSKNQIMWGANHYADRLPNPKSSCWVVWDKVTGDNDFADCELAWTSFDTAVRKFSFQWLGMLQGDMKNKEVRIHPTQKPVKLYEWLLSKYAKEGHKILDTHGGSLSNVIACLNLGYEIVCTELDEHYFSEGVARVRKSQQQQRLFA